jgi:hypothetical protein|tara:strand:+ start:309 stop:503 length:195 start_codon:yes stop_codon:yes gene_type:complete
MTNFIQHNEKTELYKLYLAVIRENGLLKNNIVEMQKQIHDLQIRVKELIDTQIRVKELVDKCSQ